MHGIKCVSCFPGHVGLKGLFPAEGVINLPGVAGILDIVSVAKGAVRREGRRLPRLDHFVPVAIKLANTMDWHAISTWLIPDLIVAHCSDWSNVKCKFTIAICGVSHSEAWRISCDHRHLTSIAAVEHSDQRGVPVCGKSVVTIELQLVCLVVVVLLNHVSGVVNVSGVLMPHVLHHKGRWVR